MPTFKDVPCVICDKSFSWQNDVNPHSLAPLCCQWCRTKEKANFTCRFCGKHQTNRYIADEQMIVLRICFSCHHWIGLLTKPHENTIITPDHKHYQAAWRGIKKDETRFLGFGGQVFRIENFNGSYWYTNNLWSQGDIPELWWPRFPANVASLESPSIATI